MWKIRQYIASVKNNLVRKICLIADKDCFEVVSTLKLVLPLSWSSHYTIKNHNKLEKYTFVIVFYSPSFYVELHVSLWRCQALEMIEGSQHIFFLQRKTVGNPSIDLPSDFTPISVL